MSDNRTFVIIGASLAGAKAAEALREAGYTGRLVLVGEETELPYERPPLSKGYLHGKDAREKAFVHDRQWYVDHDVELRLGTRATAVDPAAHEVTLGDGEHLHYDKLLLATGSRARRVDVPGTDLDGVCYLRTMAEAEDLLARVRGAGHVVVIGAGWIGMETAAAARHHGAEVTVVELDTLPLRRVLGREVAKVFADLHKAHGVTFRFGVGVAEFRGTGGKLTSVVLADGSELPADLAVVGVGIMPNTELAAAAGLEIDNGVVTDTGLRTSDPDIYAAGDVASIQTPLLGRRIRVEHWANALNGGPAAARAMAGEDVVYDRVPYFFSDQYELGMEYVGWVDPDGYDWVVFRGEAKPDGEFLAFWVSGGRVLAGMNVNIWDAGDDIQALVRAGHAGTAVDTERLGDPSVPLGSLLG